MHICLGPYLVYFVATNFAGDSDSVVGTNLLSDDLVVILDCDLHLHRHIRQHFIVTPYTPNSTQWSWLYSTLHTGLKNAVALQLNLKRCVVYSAYNSETVVTMTTVTLMGLSSMDTASVSTPTGMDLSEKRLPSGL